MPYGSDPTDAPAGGYGRDSTEKPNPSVGDVLWAQLQAFGKGLAHGAIETGEGAAQLVGKTLPAGGVLPGAQAGAQRAQGALTQDIAGREQAYQQDPTRAAHPLAAGIGRFGGQAAATLPLSMMPGMGLGPALGSKGAELAARAGLGMAGGAAGAATQPVTGDYWPEKLKQLGEGAATGGLLGAAGGAIGPQITAPIQKLMQTFPNLVRMGQGVEGRTPEAFQRAMANQVLEPIQKAISPNTPPGDKLVEATYDVLEDAYNQVKPHLTFDGSDPAFTATIGQLAKDAAADLSPQTAAQYTNYLKTYLEKPLTAGGGTLDGDAFKRAEQRLGARVRQFTRSRVVDEQIFGEHLNNVLNAMRDTLVTQNPQYGPALQRINAAYRRFVTMDLASEYNVNTGRTFTPHDVMMTIGAGGAQARRRLSPDDRLMRAFAEAGDSMLQGRAPQWQRLIGHVVGSIGGFAAGKAMGHPILGMGAGSYAGAEAGGALAGALTRGTERPAARRIGAGLSRSAAQAGAAATDVSPLGP